MTQHKQVPIEWRGRRAEVDEEMAPLIRALWRAGISTTLSCQENRPGVAWIAFATPEDARRFLNRVAVYPDAADLREAGGRTSVGNVPFRETLYGRITGCDSEGDWEYGVFVDDYGVAEELVGNESVTTHVGPADFEFGVSIRFPRSDMPLILERLTSARGVQKRKSS